MPSHKASVRNILVTQFASKVLLILVVLSKHFQVFRQLEKEVGSAAQELSKRHESLDPVDETDEEEPGGTSAKKRREDSDETEEASEIQVMDDGDDDQDSEDGADEEVAAAAAGQGEDGQSSSGSRRRTDAEIREEVRRVFHYNMERDSGGLSPGSPGSGGRSRSYKKRLSKQVGDLSIL